MTRRTGQIALLLGLSLGVRLLLLVPVLAHLPFQLTWPVPGLAMGGLWLAPRRLRPVLTLGLVVGWTVVEIAAGGPVGPSIALVVVRGIIVLLAVMALDRWVGLSALDEGLAGLGRFVAATIAVGFAGAVIAGVLGGIGGRHGDPVTYAAASALTVALSMTVVLPFVMDFPPSRTCTGLEWVAQNAGLGLLMAACTLPTTLPSQVALGFPYVVWLALRANYRCLLLSMAFFSAYLSTLTAFGEGSLATYGDRTGATPVATLLLTECYLLALALVALPLRITVGLQREALSVATAERRSLEQLIASATGVAILTIDRDGRLTRFSPGAEAILGYSAEEVVGQPGPILISHEEFARVAAELGVGADPVSVTAALAEHDRPLEADLRHRHGSPRRLSITVTRLHDSHGRFAEYLLTGDDVTERVEIERALREALENERETAERLRQVDAIKQDLVSTVSHELRTPITSIIGNTELLLDGAGGDLPTKASQMVGSIDRNCSRLMRLVDNLLLLSKFENPAAGPLHLSTFRVADLVNGAVEAVRPTIHGGGLELVLGPIEWDWWMEGDEDQLHRVLGNLLGNAAKFTPSGGRIELAVTPCGDRIVFDVSDNGIGISPEDQERLFSRFFRATGAAERHIPGTGLGLYITHAIVDQHGGRISVHSELGEGSRFSVDLPAGPTAAPIRSGLEEERV